MLKTAISRTLGLVVLVVGMLPTAEARAGTVTVSAAISLRETIKEVAAAYEKQGGDEVEANFGASGDLEKQILGGAPVDLFISAAEKQVDDLTTRGLADASTRTVVAGNGLVLIVPADAKDAPATFEDLADAKWQRIAIGQPKTVPAGQYAAQVLEHLKLTGAVQGRLVYGANVRNVLDYVRRGEVDAGIVYSTDAAEAGNAVKVVATADPSTHDPIVYPAVAIAGAAHADAAKKFLAFVMSKPGRDIFAAHGFVTASPTTRPVAPGKG